MVVCGALHALPPAAAAGQTHRQELLVYSYRRHVIYRSLIETGSPPFLSRAAVASPSAAAAAAVTAAAAAAAAAAVVVATEQGTRLHLCQRLELAAHTNI